MWAWGPGLGMELRPGIYPPIRMAGTAPKAMQTEGFRDPRGPPGLGLRAQSPGSSEPIDLRPFWYDFGISYGGVYGLGPGPGIYPPIGMAEMAPESTQTEGFWDSAPRWLSWALAKRLGV